jgi:hypothetical protein
MNLKKPSALLTDLQEKTGSAVEPFSAEILPRALAGNNCPGFAAPVSENSRSILGDPDSTHVFTSKFSDAGKNDGRSGKDILLSVYILRDYSYVIPPGTGTQVKNIASRISRKMILPCH